MDTVTFTCLGHGETWTADRRSATQCPRCFPGGHTDEGQGPQPARADMDEGCADLRPMINATELAKNVAAAKAPINQIASST